MREYKVSPLKKRRYREQGARGGGAGSLASLKSLLKFPYINLKKKSPHPKFSFTDTVRK